MPGRKNQALVYSFAEAISGHSGISGASLVWFVTLTVPHGIRGDYVDMVQTVEALRAGWSGVRRYLHRWGCRYLRVIEPGGKRGYPHYHLIITGLTLKTSEQLLSRWLHVVPGAAAAAQKIEVVQDINNLGAYLTKTLGYVAKQWDDKRDSVHWWHYQELRYRLGIRDIAMDAKSRKYISEKYKNPASGLCCCGETKINWDWGMNSRGGGGCRPLPACILLYGQPRKQTHVKNTKIQNVNSYTQKHTQNSFFKKTKVDPFRGSVLHIP